MGDYYWDAGAAGNASIGGNWSPSGPPGSTDKAIFTSANSVEDCTMNIGSIGEIDIQDDYTGTITLSNDFTINNNVANKMQGTAAAEFDCAGYDFTCSGSLEVGDGSVGMFFYPDTGNLFIGAAKAADKELVFYINKGRLYGVNPAQTGADGDWDIYGSFVVGNSGYMNLTAGTTTIKSYAENGYATHKDKVFGVYGLGGGAAPGILCFDLTTVNTDGNPYIIDIAGASGSYLPINQIKIRTSGAAQASIATFQSTNGLTINDCFIISGGCYDTLSITDGTTSTPLSVATGTCVVGYPEGGDNYGRSQLNLNDSYFISYTDTGSSANVGDSGETPYGGPDNGFSGGSWASLCWKGNVVIDGGTATIITANCNARNLDTSTRETGFYTPSGTGSLTVFKKNYSSYTCLRAWSAGVTSEQLYGTSGTSVARDIIIKTNTNDMIVDASQSGQPATSFDAQEYASPNNINFYNLRIEPGYNGTRSNAQFSTGTYSGGGTTIFNNLYIASGCTLEPRMGSSMWYGGGSVAVSGGTRGTLWVDNEIHCSGNFNWNPWNASAEKTGWTKQMARFPTVNAKTIYVYNGGTFEAVPPKPTDGVGGATGDNWDGHTASTLINGGTLWYADIGGGDTTGDQDTRWRHNEGTIILSGAGTTRIKASSPEDSNVPGITGGSGMPALSDTYGIYNLTMKPDSGGNAGMSGGAYIGISGDLTIDTAAYGWMDRQIRVGGNMNLNQGDFRVDGSNKNLWVNGNIVMASGTTLGGKKLDNSHPWWIGWMMCDGNVILGKDSELYLASGASASDKWDFTGTKIGGNWINNGGSATE
jgi:hypothetical protein